MAINKILSNPNDNPESELMLRYSECIDHHENGSYDSVSHNDIPPRLQELMNLLCDAIDEPMSRSEIAKQTADLLVEFENTSN